MCGTGEGTQCYGTGKLNLAAESAVSMTRVGAAIGT
jgi:hypothetical protein